MRWLAPLLALAVAPGCHTDGAFLRAAGNAQTVDMAGALAVASYFTLREAADDGKSKKPADVERAANAPTIRFVFVDDKPTPQERAHAGDSADDTTQVDASDPLPPTPKFHSVFVESYGYPIGLGIPALSSTAPE